VFNVVTGSWTPNELIGEVVQSLTSRSSTDVVIRAACLTKKGGVLSALQKKLLGELGPLSIWNPWIAQCSWPRIRMAHTISSHHFSTAIKSFGVTAL